MFYFIKKHKIVILVMIVDLFIYWLLFCSGVVVPFINPNIYQYKGMLLRGTSFPRNTNQMLIWFLLHLPTSYIIAGTIDKFIFLSVIQTGIIAYFIQEFIQHINRKRIKAYNTH